MKTADEFLEELKEFIEMNTYNYYFINVVEPKKIIEKIEQFQAEQKVNHAKD